jgi:hypothetical protein
MSGARKNHQKSGPGNPVRLLGEQMSGCHFSSMSKVLSPSWMVVVMPEVSASSYCLGSGNHLLLSTFGADGAVAEGEVGSAGAVAPQVVIRAHIAGLIRPEVGRHRGKRTTG